MEEDLQEGESPEDAHYLENAGKGVRLNKNREGEAEHDQDQVQEIPLPGQVVFKSLGGDPQPDVDEEEAGYDLVHHQQPLLRREEAGESQENSEEGEHSQQQGGEVNAEAGAGGEEGGELGLEGEEEGELRDEGGLEVGVLLPDPADADELEYVLNGDRGTTEQLPSSLILRQSSVTASTAEVW